MAAETPAPAAVPSREQIEAEIIPMTYEGADLTECVERVLALFAPILAENARVQAALAGAKEVSRQAVMAFFDELSARGVDPDLMADAMEAAADKSEIAVAAIRAQGE